MLELINFSYLLERLVPWFWWQGKVKHQAYLLLMMQPFLLVNQLLLAHASEVSSNYQGSGQRMVLERILRDRCAAGAPKIWVVNGTDARDEYEIYGRRRAGSPVYGYTRTEIMAGAEGYVYLRPELYEDGPPDFVVAVETAHWATMSNQDRQLLVTLVERFKVYGTTYEINQI